MITAAILSKPDFYIIWGIVLAIILFINYNWPKPYEPKEQDEFDDTTKFYHE